MENELQEPAFKYNFITPQEYLAMERASEEKHEYYDGQVVAMGGARLNHNFINVNLLTKIHTFLEDKDYDVFISQMRVTTPTRNAYMYPDTLIVSGEPEVEDDVTDTLLNPSVVFEIVPVSVRGIGKEQKLFFYSNIPSLKEFIMVDSQKRFIQSAFKNDSGGWIFEEIKDPATSLFIRTIDFLLPLDQIYENTGL